jgi:hypothetical protein
VSWSVGGRPHSCMSSLASARDGGSLRGGRKGRRGSPCAVGHSLGTSHIGLGTAGTDVCPLIQPVQPGATPRRGRIALGANAASLKLSPGPWLGGEGEGMSNGARFLQDRPDHLGGANRTM